MVNALLRLVPSRASTARRTVMITAKFATSTLLPCQWLFKGVDGVRAIHTGSQLKSLPLRRYDGVTEVTGGSAIGASG